MRESSLSIGILALQGDVREHRLVLEELGATCRLVRKPDELRDLDGLVLPGGESTTLSVLLESSGLFEGVAGLIAGGTPVLGTCAGMVLLAREVLDGRPDQRSFGALDCVVRRNAYGRQADSFEALLDATTIDAELGERDHPLPAVFIRAPAIEAVGPGVEVLASLRNDGASVPVMCRQANVLATAFHPELTSDRRVHRVFLAMAASHGTIGQVGVGRLSDTGVQGAGALRKVGEAI